MFAGGCCFDPEGFSLREYKISGFVTAEAHNRIWSFLRTVEAGFWREVSVSGAPGAGP